jgi:hypothetical protein
MKSSDGEKSNDVKWLLIMVPTASSKDAFIDSRKNICPAAVTSKSSQNGAIKTSFIMGKGRGANTVKGNLKDKTPLVLTYREGRMRAHFLNMNSSPL